MESVAKVYMKHSVKSGIFIFFLFTWLLERVSQFVSLQLNKLLIFSSITIAATVLLGWFWINHILHCLWKSYIKNDFTKSVCSKTLVYELFYSVYITYDLKKWFDLISETLVKSFLSHIISLFRPQRVWAFYITVRARLCQYRWIV